MNRQPLILSDRIPRTMLPQDAPLIADTLQEWGLAKTKKKKSVHFCGLIYNHRSGCTVFLPREAKTDVYQSDLAIAATTMNVLARFGREVSKRKFFSDGGQGNPNALTVIKQIASDFKANGLFFERIRTNGKNRGKPDWSKTIRKELAFPNKYGQPIFSDIRTTQSAKDSRILLARIQAAVLREIHEVHSWWIKDTMPRRNEFLSCPPPPVSRSQWARKILTILPSLYSARAIRLAHSLRHYLLDTHQSKNGSFVFGVEDFHTVWEAVLRETIQRSPSDTSKNWNTKLPVPNYIYSSGSGVQAPRRGMRTDIILENQSSYAIVDAKYYAAHNSKTAPGWPDIAKQLFYKAALSEVLKKDSSAVTRIDSVFAFPSHAGTGPLAVIETKHRKPDEGVSLGPLFAPILCVYIPVEDALRAYIRYEQSITIDTTLLLQNASTAASNETST